MTHRLQSLELQGFKTFATQSRLEFPGQITAIVGPNGSGKSNIADSLRWVLGEQSYSLLRAKRTEDMIFSGSQQRSRSGMALTTLTFNNEDGWLPIDYSEVSISRRAYRDGQNEYLLNGQKVRLRDITEILAQTGLAEMSYTIIGQGLVDVALALKPDERRQLFEEAAGIGLYRSRKEEALRRLENTRKNLDRVLDIMTEIRPRLRNLERQATRFNEYQQLRDDLNLLLREWYGFHWHQKQQDLRNVRHAYDDQENRLSLLRNKYAEVKQNVVEALEELQANRKDLEASHNKLSAYHQELEQSTRQLAIIDERRRSYLQQKSSLEIDIANIEEAIIGLESQQEQLEQAIEQRLAEFNAATEDVAQVEVKLSEIIQKREAAESELASIRNKRVSFETEKVQISARLDELVNRLDTLEDERSKIEEATGKLALQEESLAHQIDEHNTALDRVVAKSEKIGLEIEEHNSRMAQVIQKKNGLSESLSALETGRAKLLAQIDVLEQAEAALSGYSEGSKAVLEDSLKGRLPQGIEPLSKHIVVDEKYERALSAALGELADLLLLPSGSQNVIVEYLESQTRDRVAVLTSEGHDTSITSKSLMHDDGIIGYASDLVQVDDNYQDLLLPLFSDIIIVKDRRSAKAVQPRLKGMERAVTLNGLVYQAYGILISGQSAAGKRIGRTRQKREMAEKLIGVESEISQIKNEIHDLTNSLDQLGSSQKKLNDDQLILEKEREKVLRLIQNDRDTLTRIGEQLTWHNSRSTELSANKEKTKNLVQSNKEQLDAIQTQLSELHKLEKEQQSAVNAYPVFEVQQELNQSQTQKIITQNALDVARQRYKEHQNRINEASERLETHKSRLSTLTEGLIEIADNEKTLKAASNEVRKSISEIEENRINPLMDSGKETENSVSALQKLEEHTHQQVILAERQYTQLQLELGRRNDQLDNLKQRIEIDFGLVSYDYDNAMDGPKPLPFEDGSVKDLPNVQEIPENLENDIRQLKTQIRRIGAINPEAQNEYLEVKERHTFLSNQIEDLEKASKDLHQVIDELDGLMERDFVKTFKAVNQEFSMYFTRLFSGGEAKLLFSDHENPVEGGIDIEARLPGRRSQSLASLSGGERSLTAVALIFALLKVSPTPFCILDEVDAMLDESNVGRFIELLKELAEQTQIVIITHNRNTVQAADVIYGVTMGRDSTSQMISLKLEDVDESYVE